MISDDLLALLRCPITMQRVAPADPGTIARLEAQRIAGRLRDRSGNEIHRPITAGLLREDGRLFYPIVDSLPVLLPEEAIDV